MGINLRKNKNSKNAGYGKYYPEVDLQKTLTIRGFAQHLIDHGSQSEPPQSLSLHRECRPRVRRLERCSSLLTLDKVSKLPLYSLNRSLTTEVK